MAPANQAASKVRPATWRFLRDCEKASHVNSKDACHHEHSEDGIPSNSASPWIVFFDFDRTLSQVHVFKTLAGWDAETSEAAAMRIEAPYALSERGQLRRLTDLGTQWTKRAFGGDERIAQLHHLLSELHGARLIIVTRGYVGVVRKCLEDVGLLHFFERIHGNVGEAYGKGTSFDLESSFLDIGQDEKEFLGQTDEGNWGSKSAVVAQYLFHCSATPHRALFIDDDVNELRELQGLIPTIQVQGDGITMHEEQKIYEKLGMVQHMSPLTSEKQQGGTNNQQSRPWWKRLCVCVDDDDEKPRRDMSDVAKRVKEKATKKLGRARSNSRPPCVYDKSTRSFLGCATTVKKVRSVQIVDQRKKDFADSYVLDKQLGRGAFGVTYKATEKNAFGRTVVVKKTYNIDASQTCSEFLHLRQMTSPHVVRVFDWFTDDNHQYIVMEYCAGGDLHHAMQTVSNMEGGRTSEWCAAVFKQVLAGVLYLHMQFHRQHNDLKPENILLDRKPRHHVDVPRAMIADFGCVVNGAYGEKSIGDPRYAAFEVRRHDIISETSDAWSLGVTLYELLTGELPFLDHASIGSWQEFVQYNSGSLVRKLEKTFAKMKFGQIQEADCAKISDPLGRELTRALLQVKPENRIPLLEARRHEFLSSTKGLLPEQKQSLSSAPIAAHLFEVQDFKLPLVLLELVTSKLQGEHLNYYANIFAEADEDHDGVLDLSSFAKLWQSVELPDGVQKPPAEEIFQTIDLDDDGQIDFDEFVAFTFDMERLDKGSWRQYMRSAFATICGPDNKVERCDFQGLFADAALPVVNHLFQEIDTKSVGYIDYPAFKEYIKKIQGRDPRHRGSLQNFSFKSFQEGIQKSFQEGIQRTVTTWSA